MAFESLVLTEEEERAVAEVMPVVRSRSPQAATVINRLLKAVAANRAKPRPFASVHEVATALNVSDQTIRNWVDWGWLPAKRRFARGPRRIPRSVLASAEALAQPRPSGRRFTQAQIQDIIEQPRRASSR